MSSSLAFLQGGGELGELIRTKDWSTTPLGPPEGWPQSLKTTLGIILNSRYPMFVFWGPRLVKIYNDGYRPITGHKHPWALGRPAEEVWPEIWADIKPLVDRALAGDPTWSNNLMLFMERNGFPEEVYFTFSYSPIPDESGGIGGMFCACTETTAEVVGERRLKVLRDLAAAPSEARTVADACTLSAAVLDSCRSDVPFALLYLDGGDGVLSLCAQVGIGPGQAIAPVSISAPASEDAWPVLEVMATRVGQHVIDLGRRFQSLPRGVWPEPPNAAIVLPLADRGTERASGALVLGISSRRPFDDEYRGWFDLLAGQVGANLANARAHEEERRRAESLAELDRAKTIFFNDVSHELRTPLTLMLGPTQDALASPERSLGGENLETVHRNAQRLLKLVNTLLDFARVEAGRADPFFEATDLPALTRDLASAFRSAADRASLELSVQCHPLPTPVHIDRKMWEKIVLNLVSNAFKFTFEGKVSVELEGVAEHVELRVRDTGVGIAPEHLPRVFDRFHRVEGVAGRTREGSGIGLALVKELVTIHGGTIEATSAPGEGTTFIVRIPGGDARRPESRLSFQGAAEPSPATAAAPYVEEALRWLPAASGTPNPDEAAAPVPGAHVLIADDNADMRDYLYRLLSPRFQVEAVHDGQSALEAARRHRPDVLLADVMMPRLDGFALLSAIRADERLQTIPIVLLSARAGEEARIEGLHAGADDYLVKPFSSRELVARIEAQLMRAKLRSLEEAQAIRLRHMFAHAPVGIAILDGPAHVVEFANHQYLQLVGGRAIEGRPIREALPELEDQGIFELLDGVYQSGDPYIGRSRRVLLQRADDRPEETYFDFVYQPLYDDEQRVTGIAVVAFDVTELTNARRQAERASRAKDEFLAMLGHELRNPLAPILTALQLLRLRNGADASREHAIIERQVKHVVRLVDDLLDVSRITENRVQLDSERLCLADVITKAIEMTSPAIDQQRHVLQVDVSPAVFVDGDSARLAQVFANLLVNAAKYTDPGGRIAVAGAVEDGMAKVTIRDTGRGIEPEMLPQIFDLFWQERQEIDRSKGGLGLGLAIVRSMVQAHGGTVDARSEGKGRGAEFIVRLPLAQASGKDMVPPPADVPAAPPAVSAAPPDVPPNAIRILVIDDNRDAAELLCEALGALGHSARLALDGPAAIETAAVFRPDVALVDLGLPAMDGFEVGRRLRQQFPTIHLVAVTGYGQDVDRRRTRAVGFADHLVKPVDIAHLGALLRHHVPTGTHRPAT